MSTTAKIAGKGLKGTGITQDIIDNLHLGKTLVFVGELQVDSHNENRKGDEAFTLNITHIEPATIAVVEDHLRNLQHALHYERKLVESGPQMQLPGDHPEDSAQDVIDQGNGVLTDRGGEPRLIDGHGDLEDPDVEPDDDEPADVDEDQMEPAGT